MYTVLHCTAFAQRIAFILLSRILKFHFAECPVPPIIIPEPNIPGKQSFVINTQTALFSLNTSVDYEVAQRYYVVLTVTDTGHNNPPLTGQIGIRVSIYLSLVQFSSGA